MSNTQTAILAAAVLGAGLIVGAALLKPWQRFAPEPPLCISPPNDAIAAQDFARENGCRLP